MDAARYIKIGTVEAVNGIKIQVRFDRDKTGTQTLTAIDNVAEYTDYTSGGSGYAEYATHRHKKIRWVPEVGAKVLCIMIPGGNGQGFVVGAI